MSARKVLPVLLVWTMAAAGCGRVPTAFETLASGDFVIHYPEGEPGPAQDVLRVLDESLPRLLDDLRPGRTGPFTVRIYPSLREFHRAIGRAGLPDWVVGSAWGDSEIRMVSPANPGPSHSYVSMLRVAVHELAHCVTMRLVGEAPARPVTWLWEGIALYQAGQFTHPRQLPYMQSGDFPRFLEGGDTTIYQIGFTVVEFIVEGWGVETVRELVLADGDIDRVLGLTDERFYRAWHEFVRAKYLD